MTHRLSKLIFLLCAALWGRSLMAQPMNLRQCMDYAVAHSAQMRLSDADRSDELAAYRQSFLAAFTPNVGAQSYAYNQYGRNLDPETNTYTDFTTFHNGYSLSGSITLFEGFQALTTASWPKCCATPAPQPTAPSPKSAARRSWDAKAMPMWCRWSRSWPSVNTS